jgi:ATP-dependent Clp protease protease subunit
MKQTTRAETPKPAKNDTPGLPTGAARRFWSWAKDEESGVRTLYLDGVIAEESWFDDDITPQAFKEDLYAGEGDIVIWLNSPGGDCVAASRIYTMLMDYPGSVTVKIDGIAASAASVVAMAGTAVLMAPTALMMVHNPLTVAIGDSEEMQKAIAMLSEVKESILNAYEIKTGLSRAKLSHLMDAETWMSANKAMELGFADGILEDEKKRARLEDVAYIFSRRAVTNSLLSKVKPKMEQPKDKPPDATGAIPLEWLEKRLSLINH